MLKQFYPIDYVEDAFSIDYSALYESGYRGIVFDIDNTLVPHGDDSTPKVDELFKRIHDIGLRTVILSNNDVPRIERFLKNIDCPYVCDAAKPGALGYIEALSVLGLPKEQVVCIGDQVFTDVLGANLRGMDCILVKYIGYYDEGPKGKRRNLEQVVLNRYEKVRAKHQNRALQGEALAGSTLQKGAPTSSALQGDAPTGDAPQGGSPTGSTPRLTAQIRRFLTREIPFCDINPACYAVSERKEIIRRHVQDGRGNVTFATTRSDEKLPHVIFSHSCNLIKRGPGIDPQLQYNKADNIELASAALNGLLIRPGETFSFWRTVGNTTQRRGYKDGRIIIGGKLEPGVGGGLCNLGNTVNLLVLHSPMDIDEFHTHSDALAPDGPVRKPLSTGTSVSYNYIDYRFTNNTDQVFQLLTWCEDEKSFAELRSDRKIPYRYEIVEEGHRFQKEGEKYYRVSKIYRETRNAGTGALLEKQLILDNHSEVMFDYSLIPEDQIETGPEA